MTEVDPAQLERLSRLIRERVGLHVRPDAWGILRLALGTRLGMGATPGAVESFVGRLEQDPQELQRLVPLVTVGKTSFFRDEGQFAALAELLPGLLSTARGAARTLAVWSAGCSTGEELWSLAIALLEAGAEPAEVELLGSDLNPEALEAAAAGRYRLSRTSGLGPERLARHFAVHGQEAAADARLRRVARRFVRHNLARDEAPRPAHGAWDVIFCRNVLIYFDQPTARVVLDSFLRSLRPGGWLFLGYSESLFRIYDGFELVEVGGSFVYRKPRAPRTAPPAPVPPAPLPAAAVAPAPRAIRTVRETPARGFDEAVAALREGDFDAARLLLEAHCRRDADDLRARLTLAHLYVLLKLPVEAERCYEIAVQMEPMRAETHLFRGIHLLARGEPEDARASLARALYLEPELTLGHYFQGRCLERLQRPADARRAYRNAIESARDSSGPRRWLGEYPDLPGDDDAFARAAASALEAL